MTTMCKQIVTYIDYDLILKHVACGVAADMSLTPEKTGLAAPFRTRGFPSRTCARHK